MARSGGRFWSHFGKTSRALVSPLAWSSALPFAKGAKEGIRVFVPEQASRLGHVKRGIEEVVLREFSPSIAQQLTETGTFFRHPALQGADAHAQIFRHLAEIGTMPAKEPQQDPSYPGRRRFAPPSAPPSRAPVANQASRGVRRCRR
jgi:hypothetical protein